MAKIKQVKDTRIPLVVTTEHKGVFFGYVTPETDQTTEIMLLESARMCVYWTAEVKSVLGLAATGPRKGCRIGPAVSYVVLQGITSVIGVSPEAAHAWEEGLWE